MAIQRNASYCSFDVVVPIAKENIYNDEEKDSNPKSTASSWDFEVDFEQNARNLNLINATTTKTKSLRKMTSFLVPITRTIGIFTTRVATVDFLP